MSAFPFSSESAILAEMVSQKAGGAMLGSTIIVMAWTGVYFSRHPRSTEDIAPASNSSFEVYEIINGSDYFNFTFSEDREKRNIVKEVK